MNIVSSKARKLRPSLCTATRVRSHLFKVTSRGRCFCRPIKQSKHVPPLAFGNNSLAVSFVLMLYAFYVLALRHNM